MMKIIPIPERYKKKHPDLKTVFLNQASGQIFVPTKPRGKLLPTCVVCGEVLGENWGKTKYCKKHTSRCLECDLINRGDGC